MSKTKTVNVSFPLGSIMTVIFVIAKLTGLITWSWIWVLGLLWIPLAILVTIGVVAFLVAILAAIVAALVS
jgi:hypothetical protein